MGGGGWEATLLNAYMGLVQYLGRGVEARLLNGYMSATAWKMGFGD